MAPQKRRKAVQRLLDSHHQTHPLMALYPENCSEIDPIDLKLIPDEKITITRGAYNIGGTKKDKRLGTVFYGPASLSKPHAQFYRNKLSDSVWVKDLKSEQGTFLNGKQILGEFKRKINPGDIITFGPADNDKKSFSLTLIKLKAKINKVKKKKNSEPKANLFLSSPENSVFNIPLLIDKIFSFLPSPQNYRTINKATSFEISRHLGRSLKIKVEEAAIDPERFTKRLELFRKYKINTADFELEDDAKYGYRDLRWFGDNHGNKIINASVLIRGHDVGVLNASLRLLKSLVNCQRLVLSVHVCYSYYKLLKLELPLTSVKKLICPEFWICCSAMFNTIDPTVAVEFFKGFPNLEEMEIPHRVNMNKDLLKSLEFLIPAPGQSVLLPNLVSIIIRNPVSTQVLEQLAQIPHKLQKLVLKECTNLKAVNMVIAKHAGSLTTIKFGINGWDENGVVVIPAMAKLTNLGIDCTENLGCNLEIRAGALPELLVLKARVTSYQRKNPFELLSQLFPGFSEDEAKAKKLRFATVCSWQSMMPSLYEANANWFKEKFSANFPKAELFLTNEMLFRVW